MLLLDILIWLVVTLLLQTLVTRSRRMLEGAFKSVTPVTGWRRTMASTCQVTGCKINNNPDLNNTPLKSTPHQSSTSNSSSSSATVSAAASSVGSDASDDGSSTTDAPIIQRSNHNNNNNNNNHQHHTNSGNKATHNNSNHHHHNGNNNNNHHNHGKGNKNSHHHNNSNRDVNKNNQNNNHASNEHSEVNSPASSQDVAATNRVNRSNKSPKKSHGNKANSGNNSSSSWTSSPSRSSSRSSNASTSPKESPVSSPLKASTKYECRKGSSAVTDSTATSRSNSSNGPKSLTVSPVPHITTATSPSTPSLQQQQQQPATLTNGSIYASPSLGPSSNSNNASAVTHYEPSLASSVNTPTSTGPGATRYVTYSNPASPSSTAAMTAQSVNSEPIVGDLTYYTTTAGPVVGLVGNDDDAYSTATTIDHGYDSSSSTTTTVYYEGASETSKAKSSICAETQQRHAVLSYEQVCRLNGVMNDLVSIHGRGNFPTLEVRLRDLVTVVRAKLEAEPALGGAGMSVRDIRLNGGCASHVLATDAQPYNDLDLIFAVELSNGRNYDKVKAAVLGSLFDLLPEGVSRKRITTCSLKEAYVSKMVKVNNDGDRWSLISLGNSRGHRNVELKFVDSMRRQFEFSVDSFQIVLDSLLAFYERSKVPMGENLYPTIVGESVYGDFHEAIYHLQKKLISTRHPEEIRGGGLLKYCNLLVKNYKPAQPDYIKTLERYMCSRFFIDFPDIGQQRAKLENYLWNHFVGPEEETLKYQYLMLLHSVVEESTVCLMGHERRQTLALIENLAYQVLCQEQQQRVTTVHHQQHQVAAATATQPAHPATPVHPPAQPAPQPAPPAPYVYANGYYYAPVIPTACYQCHCNSWMACSS